MERYEYLELSHRLNEYEEMENEAIRRIRLRLSRVEEALQDTRIGILLEDERRNAQRRLEKQASLPDLLRQRERKDEQFLS